MDERECAMKAAMGDIRVEYAFRPMYKAAGPLLAVGGMAQVL
jgi:hypothetical protein